VIFNSDSFPIQIDSGASQRISNDKSHFESIKPLEINDPAGILGLTGEKSPIKGKGTRHVPGLCGLALVIFAKNLYDLH
jgi:hypothetical protein